MKKILCLMVLILSFAGSAFATTVASTTGGQTIKGGADATAAGNSPTPLVKFSTGVFGLVNFTANVTAKTSAGYLLATRHSTGSKNFSTASNSTAIYWKQVSTGTDTAARLAADVGTQDETGTTYAPGNGWTAY
jgi:hypothetical protein